MSSPNKFLAAPDRRLLLQVARDAIVYGLEQGQLLSVIVEDYPTPLQVVRASFVTLHGEGQLRGCIGTLEARAPVVQDVSEHAFAAAFRDPRFPPLEKSELPGLSLSISILSPAEPISFRSEKDLLGQLNPGIDGLILRQGKHRATFLPSVWKHLPKPRDFLSQLKIKAGLPRDYWSSDLIAERYTTESFSEPDH